MRSRLASWICWTTHKKQEDILDDLFAESFFKLFLKIKDSQRIIVFN